MGADRRQSGKGSTRRPRLISRAEEDLNWALAYGKITFAEWEKKKKKLLREGKIIRKGR